VAANNTKDPLLFLECGDKINEELEMYHVSCIMYHIIPCRTLCNYLTKKQGEKLVLFAGSHIKQRGGGAQLVGTLRRNAEGGGFDSHWGHWDF